MLGFPIQEDVVLSGFTSEVYINQIPESHEKIYQGLANYGSAYYNEMLQDRGSIREIIGYIDNKIEASSENISEKDRMMFNC